MSGQYVELRWRMLLCLPSWSWGAWPFTFVSTQCQLACDGGKSVLQANGRCRRRSIHGSTGTRAIDSGPRPHGLDAWMADTCASAAAAGDLGDALKFLKDWGHAEMNGGCQLKH